MHLLSCWRAVARSVALAAPLLAVWPAQADAPQPPVAAKKPKDVSVHGDRRVDDYFWLREKDDPRCRPT